MRFLALLFLAVSCSTFPGRKIRIISADDRMKLVGHWYGEEGHHKRLIHRKADGTFEITYKIRSKKGFRKETYSGWWGAYGDVLFTSIKFEHKGTEKVPYFTAMRPRDYAFEILELQVDRMTTKNIDEGSKSTVERVPESFRL